MKATTTFAALFVIVCSAAAAIAQTDMSLPGAMYANPTMIRPQVSTVLSRSDYLGLAIESHNGRGLKVFGTVPGGAAETIGLEKGDIIIGAEGYYCDTLDQLEQAMRTSFGSIKVTVINVRNGQWVTANMRFGANGGSVVGTAVGYDQELGIGIEMLYGGRNKVTSIEPNSIAKKLGLTVGDIILKQSENNGKYEVTFKDAESGLTYKSWYQTWRSNP